jgi:hypothetical protein
MLNETTQTQKVTYCIIHLHEISRIGKSTETEHRLVVARIWTKAGVGNNYLMSMGLHLGVIKNVLELDNDNGCTIL